jgi:glutathione S-transferase
MLTLYDYMDSGNGYKVRLVLARLGLPYKLVLCDILKGETRTPEFLARNPNGRIPTLQLEDGTFLAESGAIIWYLADGTPLAPRDRKARAETLQWMFFEQYSHEPYVAVARHWLMHDMAPSQEALEEKQRGGYAALDGLERGLSDGRDFLVDGFSIADIALYAYTHVAHQGGFDLSGYPRIRAWVDRVAAQPGYVSIDA